MWFDLIWKKRTMCMSFIILCRKFCINIFHHSASYQSLGIVGDVVRGQFCVNLTSASLHIWIYIWERSSRLHRAGTWMHRGVFQRAAATAAHRNSNKTLFYRTHAEERWIINPLYLLPVQITPGRIQNEKQHPTLAWKETGDRNIDEKWENFPRILVNYSAFVWIEL